MKRPRVGSATSKASLARSRNSSREFYDSYASSRSMAIHRLKRTFESLDRRIRRMESIVTSGDFNWDERLKE